MLKNKDKNNILNSTLYTWILLEFYLYNGEDYSKQRNSHLNYQWYTLDFSTVYFVMLEDIS